MSAVSLTFLFDDLKFTVYVSFDDTLLLEYPLPLTRPFFHLGLLTATSTHPVSSCFCIPLSVLSGQFHILLFNSLFRVLFQFSFTVLVRYRSDHLALFSVRCHLPPASLFSYNTPKLYYSQADPQYYSVNPLSVYLRDFHSLWCCFPSNFGKHTIVDIAFLCLPTNYNSSSIIVWNPILILHYCCLSFSLAVTMDISFDFFFLRWIICLNLPGGLEWKDGNVYCLVVLTNAFIHTLTLSLVWIDWLCVCLHLSVVFCWIGLG